MYAGSLDDANLKVRLLNTGYNARYAPRQGGHPGYLLWVRGQTLMAQPFEARTLRLEGEATRVAEGVGLNGVTFCRTSRFRAPGFCCTERVALTKAEWSG